MSNRFSPKVLKSIFWSAILKHYHRSVLLETAMTFVSFRHWTWTLNTYFDTTHHQTLISRLNFSPNLSVIWFPEDSFPPRNVFFIILLDKVLSFLVPLWVARLPPWQFINRTDLNIKTTNRCFMCPRIQKSATVQGCQITWNVCLFMAHNLNKMASLGHYLVIALKQ